MRARSLWNVLTAAGSGRIDPARDHVVTGRERHVASAREGNLPYPHRALRTDTHLYIRNFAPERWPMGDPKGLDDPSTVPPDIGILCHETRACYADLDAGPTKAWMIHHRADAAVSEAFALGFAKRPAEELYDLRSDPDQMRNLAADPAQTAVKDALWQRLHAILEREQDPRVVGSDCRFERSPYTDWPIAKDTSADRLARA